MNNQEHKLPDWATHAAICTYQNRIEPALLYQGNYLDSPVPENGQLAAAFEPAYWMFIPKRDFERIEECKRTGRIDPSLFKFF